MMKHTLTVFLLLVLGFIGCSQTSAESAETDTATLDTQIPSDTDDPPTDVPPASSDVTTDSDTPSMDVPVVQRDTTVDSVAPTDNGATDTQTHEQDADADPVSGNTCPYGDGGYCGSRFPDQDVKPYYLYACSDGVLTLQEDCEWPCQEASPPFVDFCTVDPYDPCPYGDGSYCGASVGLVEGTLFDCVDGAYTPAEVCGNGCIKSDPPGTDTCQQ